MEATSAVAEIAAAQRERNARRATATLLLLTVLSIGVVIAFHAPRGVAILLTVTAVGQACSYWLVKRGRSTAGVLLSGACLYIEDIGIIPLSGDLGPVPFIAPVVILLVAATAEARWLPVSFASCLVTIAIEGWLSPWRPHDQQAITTAALYATLVFVVSLLHVRGTEHAFGIAEKQDQARALAAADAVDSERRYRLIADATDDVVALVDRAGRALYLSPSHERVLGVQIELMLGKPVGEFLSLENFGAAEEAFTRAVDQGQGRVDLRVRRADDTLRILDANMKRVETDQGLFVVIMSRDVTERRELELRLQASEKLEALGRLAGSVAHDFNNLLTVIGGASELARNTLPPEHPARVDLDSVLDATGTAANLARQLLTFSRKQILVRVPLGLGQVLVAQRDLLTRMVGSGVRLEYQIADDLPVVMMPRAQFEQLAMNLAVNARDAMPDGGRLLFALRRRRLADREVNELVAGDYLELEVRDEGTGIPDHILPHLFEPFFSTKGVRGTGLGLATCFGIVAQAGGAIRVESEVGKGTAFRVFFPIREAAATPVVGPPVPHDVRGVLVVDDDPSVREMTTRMLRAEGHEVHTAATLAEARRILHDRSIALDAMLTDVVLGTERGTDLIAPCRRDRPDVRIIVMSGYTPDDSASQTLATYGADFLPKPFGREDLIRALRGDDPPTPRPPLSELSA